MKIFSSKYIFLIQITILIILSQNYITCKIMVRTPLELSSKFPGKKQLIIILKKYR